jgi:ATP-dependent exoDNAse (exonuclease V) beta subunit
MSTLPIPQKVHTAFDDAVMLKLAREIAMDIRPLGDILETHEVAAETWDSIRTSDTFQRYLRSFIEEWTSATNAGERVRVKSLSMIEESLPEFFARMHDARENLPAKTELLKTIARFAGVGVSPDFKNGGGDKMIVTINLGADQQLRIERDINTIEGEAYGTE